MLDLRSFLDQLTREGELQKVAREVDPKFELVAVLRKVQKTVNKALFFEKVRGHTMPVVSNILGSRKMISLALNTSQDKILEEWTKREKHPKPVKKIPDGPCKEVVVSGKNVDLSKLPILTHCEKDAGPYVTAGIILFKKEPEGRINASYNRMQLVSKNKLRVRMMPPIAHLGLYQKRAEEKGKPLEAAVCVGNHPHVMFAGASKVPVEEDELEFAGAIGQRSVEVTPCKTVDVDVPVDTEIVIEGKILPNVREEEGPFGEFTDSYVTVMKNHVFEVTAITHREKPVYQAIFAGGREDQNLIALPIETQVYKAVKVYVPTVKDVSMTPGSKGFTFNCVVSIKKESEDQPKTAILSALAAHPWVKMCTVVDEDVELHDPSDVIWAVSTRCRPDKGIYVIPAMPSYTREDQRVVHQGRVGIDATVPLDCKPPFERRKIPGEEKVQLENYVTKLRP